MAVLRDTDEVVHVSTLAAAWPETVQRERCLASLLADRLAVQVGDETYALP